MFRPVRSFAAAMLLLGGMVTRAGANLPFEPVPGTPMIQTEDFGELPQEIVWKKDGATMRLIPGGDYTVGYADGAADERPVRTVTLPTFYMDKYEVSVAQYRLFMAETGAAFPNVDMDSDFGLDTRPVVAVSWNGAVGYGKWALKEVPTEAMWEVAARGPNAQLHILEPSTSGGNVIMGLGQAGKPVDVTAETADISPFGMHFMTTNVSEWVLDWYGAKGYDASDLVEPKGVADGDARVVRGGSYYMPRDAANFRMSKRHQLVPTQTRDDVGFRTVFVLRPAPELTPTPTPMPTTAPMDPNERRDASVAVVENALRTSAPRLGPDQRAKPDASISGIIGNLSPFRVHLALVDARGGVSGFGTVLAPCSFTAVPIPSYKSGTRLYLYAAAERPDEELTLQNLGEISAAESLMTILSANHFTNMLDASGEVIPRGSLREEAAHFYQKSYRPQWDEAMVQSNLTVPVRVKLTKKGTTEVAMEATLAPGDLVFFKVPGTTYSFSAEYVGATDATFIPWEMAIDDRAAFRILSLDPDTEREDRVRVFSQMVPYMKFRLQEAIVPASYLPPKKR